MKSSVTEGLAQILTNDSLIRIKQSPELAEWLGFETRNKYSLIDSAGHLIGHAAEQQKGWWGFLLRQWLGHWRRFDIYLFNHLHERALTIRHPFCWFFQRLEIFDQQGRLLGGIQQRLAFIHKAFDVTDARGKVRYEMRSALWRPWTFSFTKHGREVALIEKRWSGVISELLSDRDDFVLSLHGEHLDGEDRLLILAAALFIDLSYFEHKAR